MEMHLFYNLQPHLPCGVHVRWTADYSIMKAILQCQTSSSQKPLEK